VVVVLDFVDVIEEKRGEIITNGRVNGFDTEELSVEIDISDDILRGNNGIKIKPSRTLDIRELRVILADK